MELAGSMESDDGKRVDATAQTGPCIGPSRELPQCALVPARSRLEATMLECGHGQTGLW